MEYHFLLFRVDAQLWFSGKGSVSGSEENWSEIRQGLKNLKTYPENLVLGKCLPHFSNVVFLEAPKLLWLMFLD